MLRALAFFRDSLQPSMYMQSSHMLNAMRAPPALCEQVKADRKEVKETVTCARSSARAEVSGHTRVLVHLRATFVETLADKRYPTTLARGDNPDTTVCTLSCQLPTSLSALTIA